MTLKRIKKQLEEIENYPKSIFSVLPDCNDKYRWKIAIVGPAESPYQGGLFFLQMKFTDEYPFREPKYLLLTKIYHPNVNEKGFISIDQPYPGWTPRLTAEKLITSVWSILNEPNPHDPLCPEIAKQYLEDKNKFLSVAREYTKLYAS